VRCSRVLTSLVTIAFLALVGLPAGAEDVPAQAPVGPSASSPGPNASPISEPVGQAPSASSMTAPSKVPVTTPAPEQGSSAESTSAPPSPAAGDPHPAEEPTLPVANADKATLPHDLSPWNMFVSADIVVQAVMIGLIIASVVTWTVWLAKSLELWIALRRTRRSLAALRKETSLTDAVHDLGKQGVVGAFVAAALAELRLSSSTSDKSGIKERVASRIDDLQVAIARNMKSGTGLLATIGATAPFVGLFGTVWGIMNSFIGISKAQTTNFAVVAPGIAEALLATALGLVAAIPAVIIYNHFSRSIAGYRALVAEAAAEVMRQLSRDLDRQAPARKALTALAAE
jgi:biopolymer transport protein ExbB